LIDFIENNKFKYVLIEIVNLSVNIKTSNKVKVRYVFSPTSLSYRRW